MLDIVLNNHKSINTIHNCTSLLCVTKSGVEQILPGRRNCIAALASNSICIIEVNGVKTRYALRDGMLSVKNHDNKCIINIIANVIVSIDDYDENMRYNSHELALIEHTKEKII